MQDLFTPMTLGPLTLANRFVFPPIKTASGTPRGQVTDRQVTLYRQIAHQGPAIVILEPMAVTADGREHPRQLCVHLDDSVAELTKIVAAIHQEDRLACLHLNHGGAAANPKASGTPPRAPSAFTCASVGVPAEVLTEDQIDAIVEGYRVAAQRAAAAGFDLIEVQAGHGYLRGHRVTLAEKADRLGGQFNLAWQAPGKKTMHDGLENLKRQVRAHAEEVLTGRAVDLDLVRERTPDLLVWATGAVQNIPAIEDLEDQYRMTSIEYFAGIKEVRGPRVLVIGAGRTGLEIAEKLGAAGFEVVATKRTDPIGSMMEVITKSLMLMRLGKLSNVTMMPHTAVKQFRADGVEVLQDDQPKVLKPFQTVILASGMRPAPGPEAELRQTVPAVEVIGDAAEVMDIYAAVHAGYDTALKY
ncbi:FAD-dependent oxidoreductase [Desulfoglaeba alkanexedens]|uniref:NADH:flavin oxidoreductase n=1 Tax=Desulfoglaeba alkanexedens ALDC TaxID=980445 RepID=A0A4P8L284_9BACT|nr:FAD-dependent oxidoreductase [Desulfoglaeba alkanexedens]QCQ22007.1 hypothetical protein FDQ92_07370 [Desulfoglaeba alkanexedens ALDC]